ncbi:MAG: hypothetical protein HY644_14675 [Acidobacteria bacterium]|nr:hypothetical protein [Acidobacteriota bacterium]
MIAELFAIFPDYELCRTSAYNVRGGITTFQKVRELMWKKAEGAKLNQDAIHERLDSKKVDVGGELRTLRPMSLREIIRLPDEPFLEVLRFYVKHPYSHSRVSRSRLIPRFLRTFFFRQLLGQAMLRKLDANYDEMFELMSML